MAFWINACHLNGVQTARSSLFSNSNKIRDDKNYLGDGTLQDNIVPWCSDRQSAVFDDHSLLIINERLKLNKFVNSGKPLNTGATQRSDPIAFYSPTFLRGENLKAILQIQLRLFGQCPKSRIYLRRQTCIYQRTMFFPMCQ